MISNSTVRPLVVAVEPPSIDTLSFAHAEGKFKILELQLQVRHLGLC